MNSESSVALNGAPETFPALPWSDLFAAKRVSNAILAADGNGLFRGPRGVRASVPVKGVLGRL
jgi:hypothetical protein